MKRALSATANAILVAAALAAGPAAAGWDVAGVLLAQAQKGGPGAERNERAREPRQNRPEERRERMTEDQRQALHRDLDKANRELYGRQQKK